MADILQPHCNECGSPINNLPFLEMVMEEIHYRAGGIPYEFLCDDCQADIFEDHIDKDKDENG